jgi:hypothetical protein
MVIQDQFPRLQLRKKKFVDVNDVGNSPSPTEFFKKKNVFGDLPLDQQNKLQNSVASPKSRSFLNNPVPPPSDTVIASALISPRRLKRRILSVPPPLPPPQASLKPGITSNHNCLTSSTSLSDLGILYHPQHSESPNIFKFFHKKDLHAPLCFSPSEFPRQDRNRLEGDESQKDDCHVESPYRSSRRISNAAKLPLSGYTIESPSSAPIVSEHKDCQILPPLNVSGHFSSSSAARTKISSQSLSPLHIPNEESPFLPRLITFQPTSPSANNFNEISTSSISPLASSPNNNKKKMSRSKKKKMTGSDNPCSSHELISPISLPISPTFPFTDDSPKSNVEISISDLPINTRVGSKLSQSNTLTTSLQRSLFDLSSSKEDNVVTFKEKNTKNVTNPNDQCADSFRVKNKLLFKIVE